MDVDERPNRVRVGVITKGDDLSLLHSIAMELAHRLLAVNSVHLMV
jgi:hypothetical protein